MVFDVAKLEHYMTQKKGYRGLKIRSNIPIPMDGEEDEDHKDAA